MAEKVGLYRVTFDVGNVGMPGAPILFVQAFVYPPTGRISGTANITQSIAPPGGDIEIHDLRGEIRYLGYGTPAKRLVALSGFFSPNKTEPILEPFSAALEIDEDWEGKGSFKYGDQEVNDVPVKPTPCE